jgi:hypothetical protein
MPRKLYICLASVCLVATLVWVFSPRRTPQYHLAAMRNSHHDSLTSWRSYLQARTWVWLAQGAPKWKNHEKALLDMGVFEDRDFTLSYRTSASADQDALLALYKRESFQDDCWTWRWLSGPGTNVLRITTSTNDMVIWEGVIREWDKPQ